MKGEIVLVEYGVVETTRLSTFSTESDRLIQFRVQKGAENCEPNEEGDIWILSPNRMQNYLHDKEKPPIEWIDMGDSQGYNNFFGGD